MSDRKLPLDTIMGAVAKAMTAQPSLYSADLALRSLDVTSLNEDDTEKTIIALAEKISGLQDILPASICVHPKFLPLLRPYPIKKTTVAFFPSGQMSSPEQIEEEIGLAIHNGADELDIVADYQSFTLNKWISEVKIRGQIDHAKTVWGDDKLLKVILESSAFDGTAYKKKSDLYDFAILAMECGADFIKTSTGKHKNGGADYDSVATMAFAIKDYYEETGRWVGLKISGGVTFDNYAVFVALVANILGDDYVANPKTFRIGASRLLDDLITYRANAGMMPAKGTVPGCTPAVY